MSQNYIETKDGEPIGSEAYQYAMMDAVSANFAPLLGLMTLLVHKGVITSADLQAIAGDSVEPDELGRVVTSEVIAMTIRNRASELQGTNQ